MHFYVSQAPTFPKFSDKVHQFPDLSLHKSSVKNCSVIRIICPNTMAKARERFGTIFGIGAHNMPPCKGLQRRVLEVGNIVNVVEPSELERSAKIKEFIINQRIDLVYKKATRSLTTRITFSDLKAEAAAFSEILRFPQVDVTPVPCDRAPRHVRRVRAVPCETVFICHGKYFTVTESDGRRAFAVSANDREQLCLSSYVLVCCRSYCKY
jgi:hypothetical protein